MRNRLALFILLSLSPALAEDASVAVPVKTDVAPTWTVSLQGGIANTFQLTLGGMFGEGPYWTDKLTASLNNAFKPGDSISAFGWSTTDMPNGTANWQAGLSYRYRVIHKRNHLLYLSGGVQRWLLPGVKSGAQDWLAAGTLNYTTSVRRVPIMVSQESWSLLRSTLPTGSLVYTQIYTQHPLAKRAGFQLLLRHGVAHNYAWGFYGAQGNRVVRYFGSLVLASKNTTIEAGCRQQFGLQDGIHYNRFWSLSVTRQLSGAFHSAH